LRCDAEHIDRRFGDHETTTPLPFPAKVADSSFALVREPGAPAMALADDVLRSGRDKDLGRHTALAGEVGPGGSHRNPERRAQRSSSDWAPPLPRVSRTSVGSDGATPIRR